MSRHSTDRAWMILGPPDEDQTGNFEGLLEDGLFEKDLSSIGMCVGLFSNNLLKNFRAFGQYPSICILKNFTMKIFYLYLY